MNMIVNLTFYQFVDIPKERLPSLREEILRICTDHSAKGTVLLATEGINAYLSGTRENIESIKTLVEELKISPESEESLFCRLTYKESPSRAQPFKRMLVKIKREIIAFGIQEVKPRHHTAPRISAMELKEWYESGKDFCILDTRNDYETKIGTFENAIDMNLKTFRQFPIEAKKLPEEMKSKPVVTFCTGGIRCEKAAALLENYGFEKVYQLDGGILKYFEECGGSHYNGECFVFDYRVGVDCNLKETETELCYNCQMPVTPMEQRLASYKKGKSCLHCINGKSFHKEKIAQDIALGAR